MNKTTIIQNIITNYGRYGVTSEIIKKDIIPLIDNGIKEGFTYDLTYLNLRAMLDRLTGQEFYCTSNEMARAFGVSDDEINRIINKARQELAEAGENPDDYLREVPSIRFVV